MTHPSPAPEESPARAAGRMPDGPVRKPLPLWAETILLLAIAVLLAVVVKAFFLQAFYIPSPSMEPQLVRNDRILVEKVSYWGGGTPQRGDIVVFADPGGWLPPSEADPPASALTKVLTAVGLYPSGGHLVKRVIGVAGDRIDCPGGGGPLEVNGHPLDEAAYVLKGPGTCATPYGPFHVRVPAGDLWVMGDNRADSADSRAHRDDTGSGFVPVDLVVGKAVTLVWPLSRFQLLHRPADLAGVPSR